MPLMEKPIVVTKIHEYIRKVRKNNHQIGSTPRAITIDYNNVCNYQCEFCYEIEDRKYNNLYLDLDLLRRTADEAHELGFWEVILQGGELLVMKEKLLQVIEALGPDRFRVVLVTNGSLMTQDFADILAKAGVDCIGVSMSTMNAEEHDRSRKAEGAHEKALKALEYAKNAGMTVWMQPIFGHHNSHSEELYELLEYAKEHDYGVYFMIAMPYGIYKDDRLDAEDMRIFSELRKKYNCWFDTWDFYDKDKKRITGCWALNRLFITPKGDVLPCPFINIKVGNLKESSLKEILDYGFGIKYFGQYSPVCLAAQNQDFRDRYLQGNSSMFDPPEAKDVFGPDDFIE